MTLGIFGYLDRLSTDRKPPPPQIAIEFRAEIGNAIARNNIRVGVASQNEIVIYPPISMTWWPLAFKPLPIKDFEFKLRIRSPRRLAFDRI